MKKIEHWQWMTKEKTKKKTVYKGDKELIQEIEILEDEICVLKKEIASLKLKQQESYVKDYYSVPLNGTYGTFGQAAYQVDFTGLTGITDTPSPDTAPPRGYRIERR